jgi:hypothetical protein
MKHYLYVSSNLPLLILPEPTDEKNFAFVDNFKSNYTKLKFSLGQGSNPGAIIQRKRPCQGHKIKTRKPLKVIQKALRLY